MPIADGLVAQLPLALSASWSNGALTDWWLDVAKHRLTLTELHTSPPKRPGRSYVNGDGIVEVPPFVLDALGLPRGGGVFFAVRKADGIVEMLSHQQLLAIGGYDDEGDGAAR